MRTAFSELQLPLLREELAKYQCCLTNLKLIRQQIIKYAILTQMALQYTESSKSNRADADSAELIKKARQKIAVLAGDILEKKEENFYQILLKGSEEGIP